jgi:acyl carrier protein
MAWPIRFTSETNMTQRGRTQPTWDDIRDRVRVLLQDICHIPPERINDKATIDRELEMESVEMVELQVAIESEYDIVIDFMVVLKLNRLGLIIDYIASLVNVAGP